MNKENLIKDVQEIVKDAAQLRDKFIQGEEGSRVNYTCIFSQSEGEYIELMKIAAELGNIVKETKSGNLYHVNIPTSSGLLRILKIRHPDSTKPERGDADFTVNNYYSFKQEYLPKEGFNLIERPYMEMIELMIEGEDIRVYFSNPPVDEELLD